MKPHPGRGGFSLVELLATVVTSAILALAMGSVLYFSYSAMSRNAERITLQRDATFAFDMFSRMAQGSSPAEITLASKSVTFATNSFRAKQVRFFDNNTGDLVYDPDIGVGGNEMIIVNDRLASFNVTMNGSRLIFQMVVSYSSENLTYSNSVTMRN
jgi:Tfp pilus assembly protein PilW